MLFRSYVLKYRSLMKQLVKEHIFKIPFVTRALSERDAKIAERGAKLLTTPLAQIRQQHLLHDSYDNSPWNHPFLKSNALKRFRTYSDTVISFAVQRIQNSTDNNLNSAFSVNMAQNMYKWGCLAQKYGAKATLLLHPHDQTALSSPEWEECDGEYHDLLDGSGFHAEYPGIKDRKSVV
mgnify:CR=1 FL=1